MAEYAGASPGGKLTIAGTIDEVQIHALPGQTPDLATAAPFHIPHAYLVAQVEFSISDGLRHTASLGHDDDGKQVIHRRVDLPPMGGGQPVQWPMRHNSIMRIAGLVCLPRVQDIFEIEVDGKVIGSSVRYM